MRDDNHLPCRRRRHGSVSDNRRDLVINPERREVDRPAIPAREVDCQHGTFDMWLQPVQGPRGAAVAADQPEVMIGGDDRAVLTCNTAHKHGEPRRTPVAVLIFLDSMLAPPRVGTASVVATIELS